MTSQKPNLLFIMADQYRWDYLGAQGADFVHTPNLDSIANRGVRFTQCTTNCPICAPARIGLATGLQPTRLGALDNASFLPHSVPTYYQRLRDHGYRVGCIGKLDLAKPDAYNGRYGDRPCLFSWGFTHPEETEGKMHAGMSPTPLGPYGFWLQQQGLYDQFHKDYIARKENAWIKNASHDSVLPAEAFEDIYIGKRAAEFLEKVPDDFPWHYFVSFVGPHDPFDPPTEYADLYRNTTVPPAIQDNLEGKPRYIQGRDLGLSKDEISVTRRQYCASIQTIDDSVGWMLEALEHRGMLENTVVVFSSDHGEMLGDHGVYTKSTAYESAIRVPLLIAGSGIEGGWASEALVELIDINPTLCEIAGLPSQENIDARSLIPVLNKQVAEIRTETVSAMRNFRCLRTHQYKYIQNYNDIDELYDLQADPDELHNIAENHSDGMQKLNRRLSVRFMEDKWLR
ncbi:MAG: sulfatase-like hydrolase/transferase [Anaerolineae bacterium]|nr:sulfatase-like hydrolase/transferase [Anaerolineae bacterium]